MAQVTQDPQLQDRIDDYLDYLINSWEGIPQLAAEWAEWDADSQLCFVLNWGVPSDRLAQIRGWAEQGMLTPSQLSHYRKLEGLVAEYQPLLDWMLAE
jgi:hypothetical protein